MTDEEIAKNNGIIAEFMGYIYSKKVLLDLSDCGGLYEWYTIYSQVPIEIEDENYLKDEWWKNNRNKFRINLEYSYDWNELMPCINKIYESPWYYKWKDTSGQFEKEIFINTKFIETTWEQVVEFIKWYNTQKND